MLLLKNNREFIGIVICLFSAIIFGLYPPAARSVYLDGGNITFVVLMTTFWRMAGLTAFATIKKQTLFQHINEYKTSLYAGALQAISIIGILGGAYFMAGAIVIVIMFTYSLMLLFFTAWRGEIALNSVNILSTLVALLGLALVLDLINDENTYPLAGIALAFMAALATFGRTYIFGQQSKTRHPVVTGAETFIVAFILLLVLLFWQAPTVPQTSYGIIMIALASLALTIGSFGMFYGIAYLGSYKFSMIMKLEPVFTTLFGIILVGDNLHGYQYIGILLIVASLIALQLFDKQK